MSDLQDRSPAELIEIIRALQARLAVLEASETARGRAIEELLETKEKYRVLLDESSDPIFMFYPTGEYRYVNKAFAEGVQRLPEQIIGKKIWDVFPKDEADKRFTVVKWVFENGQTRVIEVRVPRTDGDRYYITTAKPIMDDTDSVISVICISKDITERKRIEQELQQLSTHDSLTRLYNRHFFETELERLQSSRLHPICIVIVDMNNLKVVNDSQGHAAGDIFIKQVASVLQHSFRTEDIVARIGGDEFAALLPRTDEQAAQTILSRLNENIALEQKQQPLFSLSIGYAIAGDGDSLADTMRLADDRMYQNKRHQKRAMKPRTAPLPNTSTETAK